MVIRVPRGNLTRLYHITFFGASPVICVRGGAGALQAFAWAVLRAYCNIFLPFCLFLKHTYEGSAFGGF